MELTATSTPSGNDSHHDEDSLRNWNINRRMAGYCDSQMTIPMLQWLKAQKVRIGGFRYQDFPQYVEYRRNQLFDIIHKSEMIFLFYRGI